MDNLSKYTCQIHLWIGEAKVVRCFTNLVALDGLVDRLTKLNQYTKLTIEYDGKTKSYPISD
jgi:hypothetical protein